MNTLKLKVVFLCFIFLMLGYTIANYQHIKDKFCEVKQTSAQTTTATFEKPYEGPYKLILDKDSGDVIVYPARYPVQP